MHTTATASLGTTVAATVAPEDLQCGDVVATLNSVVEYPSFFWCSDATTLTQDEPVRMRFRADGAGIPLQVRAICLPFVFVRNPRGGEGIVDIRATQLVRLDPQYAKQVWKSLKPKRKRRKKRSNR